MGKHLPHTHTETYLQTPKNSNETVGNCVEECSLGLCIHTIKIKSIKRTIGHNKTVNVCSFYGPSLLSCAHKTVDLCRNQQPFSRLSQLTRSTAQPSSGNKTQQMECIEAKKNMKFGTGLAFFTFAAVCMIRDAFVRIALEFTESHNIVLCVSFPRITARRAMGRNSIL